MDHKLVDPSVWLLIAYKPSSDDFCRGCLMASYQGDFEIFEFDNQNELIEKGAELKAQYAFMGPGEAGYQLTVIQSVADIDMAESTGSLLTEIDTNATAKVEVKRAELRILAYKKKGQQVVANAKKELAELTRLKAKYDWLRRRNGTNQQTTRSVGEQ